MPSGVTGLAFTPANVVMRIGVVFLSTDGNNYYNCGMVKNIKISCKPIVQKDNAQEEKTVGYTLKASWRFMQIAAADAALTLLGAVNTTRLYVKITDQVGSIKNILGPTFVVMSDTELDFDGGESFADAYCTYITDPTTAQSAVVGSAMP